jgi:hypothetical protein
VAPCWSRYQKGVAFTAIQVKYSACDSLLLLLLKLKDTSQSDVGRVEHVRVGSRLSAHVFAGTHSHLLVRACAVSVHARVYLCMYMYVCARVCTCTFAAHVCVCA